DLGLSIADTDIGTDIQFVVLHIARHRLLHVVRSPLTLPGDEMRPEPDREAIPVGGLPRFADRHDDTPPVWIAARNGSLHDRRVGDRHRYHPCRAVVLGARHFDFDELAQTLAVLDDGNG